MKLNKSLGFFGIKMAILKNAACPLKECWQRKHAMKNSSHMQHFCEI
jgi:hypothetical protein